MKIFGIGMNYALHNKELDGALYKPEEPVVFTKADSALLRTGKPFFVPDWTAQVDYEAELVIRICRLGKGIPVRFAHRYYDAMTVGIDFTARDLQREARQKGLPWTVCKGFDGSAVLGDWVPKEELPPVQGLHFRLDRNGQTVQQGHTADMLYNLRVLAVHGDESHGFLNYSYVLNQVLLVVALWQYPRVPMWQLVTIIIASLMSAFAIMEKGMVFFLFAAILFTLYEKRVIRMRSIFFSALFIVVLFFFINVERDYREDANPDEATTFLDFFAIYVLSPSVAFERVQEDLSPQFGSHTFQTLYLFLNRFGGDYEVNTKLQEFVWVPLPTNVYTVFQPFFEDFKYKGVALFALFYGLFSGWCYRLMRNGDGFGKCLYVYVVYVLALQFFQENVFVSIVTIIQFMFFVLLIQQQKLKMDFTPQPSPDNG